MSNACKYFNIILILLILFVRFSSSCKKHINTLSKKLFLEERYRRSISANSTAPNTIRASTEDCDNDIQTPSTSKPPLDNNNTQANSNNVICTEIHSHSLASNGEVEPYDKAHRFYVIELMFPPYKDMDKYVCVPKSWIIEATEDGTYIVKYPVEKASITEQRVRNEELFRDNWSIIEALIKHASDVYTNAKNHVKILLNEHAEEMKRKISATLNTNGASTAAKRKSLRFSSDNQSPSTSKHTLDNTHTRENTINHENSNYSKGYTEYESSVHHNNSGHLYSIRLPATPDISVPSTSMHPLDEIRTRENPNNNRCITEKMPYSKPVKRIESSANQSTSKLTNESLNPTKAREIIIDSNLPDLLQALLASVEETKKKLECMQRDHEQTFGILHEVAKLFKNCNNNTQSYKPDIALSNGREATAAAAVVEEKEHEEKEKEKKRDAGKRKRTVRHEDVHDDYSDDDDKEDEYNLPNKQQVKVRRQSNVILPSGYAESDLTWTVRHREEGSELEELMPGTGIYVKTLGLQSCIHLAKEPRDLAQLLLPEVFTHHALSICSFTTLHKQAMTALLDYVKQPVKSEWFVDEAYIKSEMCCKLSRYRNKYYL